MELKEYIDEVLYPSLWERLDCLFPEMEFTQKGGKWISPRNLNGSSPKNRRPDKTVVTQKLYNVALENGEGGAKDLITLYLEHNGIKERIEGIKQIAEKLGLELPQGKNSAQYEAAQRKREEITLSYVRQKEALFSLDGEKVLRYLKEVRGYSEELIKGMGIGYISPAEATHLEQTCNIGIQWNVEDFPLSIPYYSRGHIIGFKCRYVSDEAKAKYGNTKYMNTKSLGTEGMDNNPFGLIPSRFNTTDKKKEAIVVEGELDALHAIALGLPNVIASAGGRVTQGKASTLKKAGYNSVILLLDSDESGQKFTETSIKELEEAGIDTFVATLPDSKDTDEYLGKHSIEELKETLRGGAFGAKWLYERAYKLYNESPQGDADLTKFLKKSVDIAVNYADPIKRSMIFANLASNFGEKAESYIRNGLEEKAEALIKEKEAKARERALKIAREQIKEASNSLEGGLTLKAAGKLKKAISNIEGPQQESEYRELLKDNTDELWRQYKEAPIGLKTNYYLKSDEIGSPKDGYQVIFPSGAVSIIGAPTNHGKSKVLQSLALDSLPDTREGEMLLYITYEENELNINKNFLNAFANVTLTRQTAKYGNIRTISEYLKSGSTEFMKEAAIGPFKTKEEEWKEVRRSGRIKIVKPSDIHLETLIGLIDYAVKQYKIKAIFLDYIQEIYVQEWNKYSRTDELKQAMEELDKKAQETNIPIIAAAQLNSKVLSPLELENTNIADSYWIARKASEIILLWSNRHLPSVAGDGIRKVNDAIGDIKKKLGVDLELGKGGKLYFKLTKSRVIPVGSQSIVYIDPNTGRVKSAEGRALDEARKNNEPQEVYTPSLPRITQTSLFENEQEENEQEENEQKDLPF